MKNIFLLYLLGSILLSLSCGKKIEKEKREKKNQSIKTTAGSKLSATNALIYAIKSHDHVEAEIAISNGADVNAKILLNDNVVDTLLTIAARENNIWGTNLLLENEAKLNEKLTNGNTAIFVALLSGNSDIAIRLLNLGAKTHITNKNGRNPFIISLLNNLTNFSTHYIAAEYFEPKDCGSRLKDIISLKRCFLISKKTNQTKVQTLLDAYQLINLKSGNKDDNHDQRFFNIVKTNYSTAINYLIHSYEKSDIPVDSTSLVNKLITYDQNVIKLFDILVEQNLIEIESKDKSVLSSLALSASGYNNDLLTHIIENYDVSLNRIVKGNTAITHAAKALNSDGFMILKENRAYYNRSSICRIIKEIKKFTTLSLEKLMNYKSLKSHLNCRGLRK